MAKKVNSSKGKKNKGDKGLKQDNLLPPPDGKFKQDKVDGSGVLKETPSKEIQDRANNFFAAKTRESKAKADVKETAEKLLQQMEFEKKTVVLVYNDEEKRKDRIWVKQGEEKLKVEKNVVVTE